LQTLVWYIDSQESILHCRLQLYGCIFRCKTAIFDNLVNTKVASATKSDGSLGTSGNG